MSNYITSIFQQAEEESEAFDSETFGICSSQSKFSQSQQSSYIPSSQSTKGQDSEQLDDSYVDGKIIFLIEKYKLYFMF